MTRTPLGLARMAKRAGMTKEEFVERISDQCTATAKKDGWRRSELAVAIAGYTMAADKAWPKRDAELEDRKAIRRIVGRYSKLVVQHGDAWPRGTTMQYRAMLTQVHKTNNLNLEKLESFDDFNFCHDVSGCMARAQFDGTFTNGFWPRCGSRK